MASIRSIESVVVGVVVVVSKRSLYRSFVAAFVVSKACVVIGIFITSVDEQLQSKELVKSDVIRL